MRSQRTEEKAVRKNEMDEAYTILGVSQDATDEEIKKAYRRLSKKYHPDANLNQPEYAERKFKEIQEAYKKIMDFRKYGASGGNPYGNPYQGGQSSYGETAKAETVRQRLRPPIINCGQVITGRLFRCSEVYPREMHSGFISALWQTWASATT